MPGEATIFALSTAPGKSGIAVVRVSGPAARTALQRLAPPLPEPRKAVFRKIRRPDGELLDSALVLWFAAPRTETGEDMVEFHLHGSRAVVAAVLETLSDIPDLRPAQPGEFARRAFENGKLDLTAVEGLADLVEAETSGQRRQALRQLDGHLMRRYEDWRTRLIRAMALVEAGIDFSDEADIPGEVWGTARAELMGILAEISACLADGRRGERIRDGAVLVVAGPPNAGKSSLLNLLAGRDVAIVSDIPGTTRDAIEVRLALGGMAVTAVDTAGLREARDAIEAEGVRRAERHVADADLVLWVFDSAAPSPVAEIAAAVPVWRVANKCDLIADTGVFPDAEHFISALTGLGLDELIQEMSLFFRERFESGTDPVITRERHRRELKAAESAIRSAVELDYAAHPDRVAEELRVAGAALGRVVGRIDVEDLLDVIFREFCVGK